MPSVLHEALVQLFRDRPELAPRLIEQALHAKLPAFAEARIEDASFTDIDPAEYRADLVVLLAASKPVFAIVLEVQLGRDPRKKYSWPMYAVGLRGRYECPTAVLVLTVSEEIAAWAQRPIELGPGNTWRPLVVGPRAVPIVRSHEEARRDPALAILSVMAHGKGDDEVACATMEAAVDAVTVLPNEHGLLYLDLILNSLNAAARVAFEDLMKADYEFQSEYLRNLRDSGVAEGLAAGKAASVLLVLRARAVDLTADEEARIRATRDLAQLDRWIALAVNVTSGSALFGAGSEPVTDS